MDLQATDLYEILLQGNPWLQGENTVPDYLAPSSERFLASHLAAHLKKGDFLRHHVILGPRRSGKTTVMYQVVRHLLKGGIRRDGLWWAKLDDPRLARIPLGDLVKALIKHTSASQEAPLYLFLDELVYSQDWDLWLKTFHDEKWPVRVLASASAIAALRQGHIESGIGRWEEWHLPPCGLTEALALNGSPINIATSDSFRDSLEVLTRAIPYPPILPAVLRRLVFLGGFPEFLVHELKPDEHPEQYPVLFRNVQKLLRSDAVERAIYKDLVQSFQIRNPMAIEHLLYILAGQMTGIFSPGKLAGDISVKTPTLERYLGHLIQTWMVFMLPNYARTEEATQRRGRKIYFIDGAVRNATLQLGIGAISNPSELGRLHENLAAMHLRSLGIWAGVRVHHWRQGRDEVDFVYDDPDGPLAFELGSSSKHPRSGLHRFLKAHPRFHGGCYYVAPGLSFRAATGTGVGELPLDAFLLIAGLQERAALRRRFGG